MNTSRRATVLRAAELYYDRHLTMEAIAQELGCSRATVSRLVGEARTAGLVEITVHRRGRAASTLERLIGERYGVQATVVAPPERATEGERLLHVATQAAAKLRLTLAPDTTIAITWGITIATLARNLTPGVVPGLQVVQMSGSGNTFSSGAEYASGVFDRFGAVLGARVHHFPVPAFFDSAATRSALWAEHSVQRILRLQQRADIALFSVGALGGGIPGHLYRAGYLDRADLRSLTEQGVVGDLGTVFLHSTGSSAELAMNQRSSGLPIEALRRIPRRLCVALGEAKAPVVRAALLAGAVTELIVDTTAAEPLVG
ncbi:sugar-binding transcriptional regulator [Prauserella cavernicola]|uniref:Transcriptional regulator n=1 Tax=Prauserella cavernicola TaxID=2800127 RepID=A0A934QS91_9PSEU|nr:sugar-binding domain-containing protein [Prauserella cavernicola]MBK1785268.1 transcriptional regulator [Prauserella cavernicola]